jgi:surface protein
MVLKITVQEEEEMVLPFFGTVNLIVDWGVGAPVASEDNCPTEATSFVTCTYVDAGDYTVTVSAGAGTGPWLTEFNFFKLFNDWDPLACKDYKCSGLITEVVSWGDLGVTSLSGALALGANPAVPAVIPDTVTDLSYMFYASPFDRDIGDWDTSNVTDMTGMFQFAYEFNQDIGNWNTASVGATSRMFEGASKFNEDIGGWNTSSVTDMSYMFQGGFGTPTIFDRDIGDWDTSNVTNMNRMFRFAALFNQDIGRWDTSSVDDMSGMFFGASAFNQNINTKVVTDGDVTYVAWDTSQVEDMSDMFGGFTKQDFNGDISSWNTSKVKDMNNMFQEARDFNQDINSKEVTVGGVTYVAWNTAEVTNMRQMFLDARAFDGDIGSWNTSKVINMNNMFNRAEAFNRNIGTKEVTVSGLNYIAWDTSEVIGMTEMFRNAEAFNGDIGSWNTSNVLNTAMNGMNDMFNGASAFNQDLSGWCVTKITLRPTRFDDNTTAWDKTDRLPVWGTCPATSGGGISGPGTIGTRLGQGGKSRDTFMQPASAARHPYQAITEPTLLERAG